MLSQRSAAVQLIVCFPELARTSYLSMEQPSDLIIPDRYPLRFNWMAKTELELWILPIRVETFFCWLRARIAPSSLKPLITNVYSFLAFRAFFLTHWQIWRLKYHIKITVFFFFFLIKGRLKWLFLNSSAYLYLSSYEIQSQGTIIVFNSTF